MAVDIQIYLQYLHCVLSIISTLHRTRAKSTTSSSGSSSEAGTPYNDHLRKTETIGLSTSPRHEEQQGVRPAIISTIYLVYLVVGRCYLHSKR